MVDFGEASYHDIKLQLVEVMDQKAEWTANGHKLVDGSTVCVNRWCYWKLRVAVSKVPMDFVIENSGVSWWVQSPVLYSD